MIGRIPHTKHNKKSSPPMTFENCMKLCIENNKWKNKKEFIKSKQWCEFTCRVCKLANQGADVLPQ